MRKEPNRAITATAITAVPIQPSIVNRRLALNRPSTSFICDDHHHHGHDRNRDDAVRRGELSNQHVNGVYSGEAKPNPITVAVAMIV